MESFSSKSAFLKTLRSSRFDKKQHLLDRSAGESVEKSMSKNPSPRRKVKKNAISPAARSKGVSFPSTFSDAPIALFSDGKELRGIRNHANQDIDVASLLHNIGLDQYQEAFLQVKQTALPDLCMRHLPALGVTQFRHQKAIMQAIKAQIAAIEAQKSSGIVDVNGDGHMDAIGIDTTGDGKLDSFVKAEAVDINGDGQFDAIGLDTTGDGQVDSFVKAQGVDTTGDGKVDSVGMDTTCDGRVDTIVEVKYADTTTADLQKFEACFMPLTAHSEAGIEKRKHDWHAADPNSSGSCSYAEIESWVKLALGETRKRINNTNTMNIKEVRERVQTEGSEEDRIWRLYRPIYQKAFKDAADAYAAKDGKKAALADSIQRQEFRLLCAYLCVYARMYDGFAFIDGGGPGAGDLDDKKVVLEEWLQGYRNVRGHGFHALSHIHSDADADAAFHRMSVTDNNVSLQEWCAYLKKTEVEANTAVGKLLLIK